MVHTSQQEAAAELWFPSLLVVSMDPCLAGVCLWLPALAQLWREPLTAEMLAGLQLLLALGLHVS